MINTGNTSLLSADRAPQQLLIGNASSEEACQVVVLCTHLLLPFVNREQDMTWGRPERRARVKILRSSSTVTSTTAALAISRLKVILDMVAFPEKMALRTRSRNRGAAYRLDKRSCCHSVDTIEAASSEFESK